MAGIEDTLLGIEQRVLMAGAGEYLAAIEELKRLIALGDPSVTAYLTELTSKLAAGGLFDVAALTTGAEDAYTASLLDNGAVVRRSATASQMERVGALAGDVPASGIGSVLDDAVKAAFKSRALLAAGASPETAAAVMLGNGRGTVMAIQSALTDHAAHAAHDVATITKKPLVWVAERNACVRCLAHSGHVVASGGKFPGGLTFGPYVYEDAREKPPLHPHCRCHLEVLNDPEYAAALQREARRSVLRGYSLESESMSVRVGAAKKLIESGVDAPKSVIAYGERAVKAGKFPTRSVPYQKPAGPDDQPRHKPAAPKPPTGPTPDAAREEAARKKAAAEKLAATKAELVRVKAERAELAKAERAELAKAQASVDAKLAAKKAASAPTAPPAVKQSTAPSSAAAVKAVRGASPASQKAALRAGDWRYIEDRGQRANVLLQNEFRGEQAVKKVAKNLREGAEPFAGVGLPKSWIKQYTGTVHDGAEPVRFTEADVRGTVEDAARWLNEQPTTRPRALYKGLDVPKEKIAKLFAEGADFDTNFSSFTTDQVVARRYSSQRATKQVMVRTKGVDAIPLNGNPTASHWKASKEHLVTGKGRVVKVVDDGRTVWVDVEFN